MLLLACAVALSATSLRAQAPSTNTVPPLPQLPAPLPRVNRVIRTNDTNAATAALPVATNVPVRNPSGPPPLPLPVARPINRGQPARQAADQAAAAAAADAAAQPPALTPIPPGSTNATISLSDGNFAFNWQALPLEQVLANYAELTGRTVLRPNQLPAVGVTLRTQSGLTKDEAVQALDSVLTLNGVTMIPVGEKFVTAVPSQQAVQEGAAFSDVEEDDLPEAGQYLTKMVQLKYANPQDVAQVLQGFGKVQGGVLALPNTQTLVLRDYAANIKRMMEVIRKVDTEVENDYKLEVIPIKYGKVEDIYSTMSSLIGGGGGGARGTTATGGRTSSRSRGGAGAGGRSGGLNQNRNSASGALGQTQPGMQQGNQPGGQNTFGQRLQGVLNRAGGAGSVELLGDARIVPDERSNSLIVFASKQDMVMITNIVSKVDRLLAQVLIEAVIMDVNITDSSTFGVSAVLNGQKSGKLTSTLGGNNGANLLSGITNLSTSGLPGGFNYFAHWGGNLDMAVQALASNSKGQVLQTPRVQTSHAIPASFFTGETVPYVTSTYYGGYGAGPSSSFQQLEVGIGLNVTPYITPDGLVVMDISQTIEEISGATTIAGVGDVPNTTRREADATVSVQDGDTIILGGYIRTSKTKTRSGVPFLKDIPVLGNLFRSRSDSNDRSELIVLLRPTVLPTPHDAAIIAKTEQLRLPGVREMEREMHDDEVKRLKNAEKAVNAK